MELNHTATYRRYFLQVGDRSGAKSIAGMLLVNSGQMKYNPRMKIVLATPIYPPEIGGPATYTKELCERLGTRWQHKTRPVKYLIAQEADSKFTKA